MSDRTYKVKSCLWWPHPHEHGACELALGGAKLFTCKYVPRGSLVELDSFRRLGVKFEDVEAEPCDE